MNKITPILLIIAFVAGYFVNAYFSGRNITSPATNSSGNVIDPEVLKQQKRMEDIKKLGDTKTEVVQAFYDKKNSKVVEEWVETKENWATTKQGDVIEFLSYCEKLKLLGRDKAKNSTLMGQYDLHDINNLIRDNSALQAFSKQNQNLAKEGVVYGDTNFSTAVIAAFYKQNPEILKADPSPYAVNLIYSFVNGKTSDADFTQGIDEVIAMNHQGSKLYSGLYKEAYFGSGTLDCPNILNVYGKGDETFTE